MLDFFELDPQHLLRIVPFVEGGVRIQPFVALQTDQFRAENFGQDLGDLRLADPRLSFQKHRLAHEQRKIDDRRQ